MPPRPTHQARASCRPGTGTNPQLWLLCSCRVSACRRHVTRSGSTSIQEQGGPKTRTVPYGAGSTGSDWARHWGAGEHRAHVSGTDTTPPRPGAQLARSAAGRIKRVQLGRGKDVVRQATSIVEHRVHGMCAELSSQKGRPPPDGQGRGLLAQGADRVHRPTSQQSV